MVCAIHAALGRRSCVDLGMRPLPLAVFRRSPHCVQVPSGRGPWSPRRTAGLTGDGARDSQGLTPGQAGAKYNASSCKTPTALCVARNRNQCSVGRVRT